jgi:putative transcriptional regulator
MSSKTIFSRIDRSGRSLRKTEQGWVEVEIPPLGPNFPEGEPVYDPENPPATEEQLKRARRISLAKHLRFKLGLSQAAFAERYHIPIGTLRDWEQHRSEPDAPARALLHLIAVDPEWAAEKLSVKRELSAVAP